MDDKRKIRVLQVALNMTMGGVPKDIIYPARLLDKKDVEFDLLLTSDTIGFFDDEFEKYGNIYRIPVKRGKNKITRALRVFYDPIYVYFKTRQFLHSKNGYYDAIHCRNFFFNAPCIAAADKEKIPIRIAHSHVSSPKKELPHIALYNYISKRIIKKHATLCLGVTKGALKYMVGDGVGYVIKNPTVDLSKFNPQKYEYHQHDDIRLIMVGSIQPRKNQMFGAQVLNELIKMGKEATMIIIGYPTNPESGYLESVQEYLKTNGIDGRVTFLPKDSDVAKALSESDVMLLPSLQEGLPNTALEAQTMGVFCFVSTDVESICDCGLCEFISLKDGSHKWAEAIIDYANRTGLKKTYIDMHEWDNKEVSKYHLRIWQGDNPFIEKNKQSGKKYD